MRGAIFCRVSTSEQAKKGYSLPEQIEACRTKARSLGCVIIDEFSEDESGAFLQTPGMDALREAVKNNNYSYVIMLDPDRLARNLVRQLVVANEIESAGAELIFVNGEYASTPEGRLFFSIRGAISEYEREKIKQRTQSGLRRKALSGKVPRNSRPYGYAYNQDTSTYSINEEEAKIIRLIFTWIGKEKATMYETCRRLAEMGAPTKRGKGVWHISTISGIIHNTIYKGELITFRYIKKKIAPSKFEFGRHPEENWIIVPVPAIVSEEEFQAAQETLKANFEKAPRNTRNPYLLQGLVFCPVCHHTMGIGYDGRVRIAYFFCRTGSRGAGRVPEEPRCGVRFIPMQHLEEQVLQTIMHLAKNPDKLRDNINMGNVPSENEHMYASTLENLRKKADSLKKEKDRISWMFRKGLIDEADTERQLKEVHDEQKQLQVNISGIEDKLTVHHKAFDQINDFISRFVRAFQNFEDVPYPDKRSILQEFIDKIYAKRIDKAYNSSKCVLDIGISYKI